MSLWLAGYPKTPDFDVRFGSKADIKAPPPNVRFTPESGHTEATLMRTTNKKALAQF